MAELADAPDLGSGPARGGGSSPPFRTNDLFNPDGLVEGKQITSVVRWALHLLRNRNLRALPYIAACRNLAKPPLCCYHARILSTTFPATSVSRKYRP